MTHPRGALALARRAALALLAVALAWSGSAGAAGSPAAPRDATLSSPLLPSSDVSALAAAHGDLFVGTFDRGLYRRRPDGTVGPVTDRALFPHINALLVDAAEERLWIGTARGLVRCAVRGASACERVGAAGAVHALLGLRDGTVLAGGDDGILAVSPDGASTVLDRKRGAPFRAVWALAQAPDGTLFVGTTRGLYFADAAPLPEGERRAGEGPFVMARAAMVTADLPDDWVTAVAVDGDVVHVGTYNAGLTSFLLKRGKLTKRSSDPSLGYVNPRGIELLPFGRLAVATMDGLRVGVPGQFGTVPTPGSDVTATLPGGGGRYWVATRKGVIDTSFEGSATD